MEDTIYKIMNKGKNVVDLIPTHDPQTGELNPYYERLTGEVNPLQPKPQPNYIPFVSEVEEFNHTMGKPNNYEPTIPEKKEWQFVYDFILVKSLF